MLYLIVYFFDVYEDILLLVKGTGLVLSLLAVLAYITIGLINADMFDLTVDEIPKVKESTIKIWKKSLKYALFTIVLATFLPSKQGLTMLGGVYVGQQVYEGISQSELVGKAVKVLNTELDGYLDKYLKEKETQSPK